MEEKPHGRARKSVSAEFSPGNARTRYPVSFRRYGKMRGDPAQSSILSRGIKSVFVGAEESITTRNG